MCIRLSFSPSRNDSSPENECGGRATVGVSSKGKGRCAPGRATLRVWSITLLAPSWLLLPTPLAPCVLQQENRCYPETFPTLRNNARKWRRGRCISHSHVVVVQSLKIYFEYRCIAARERINIDYRCTRYTALRYVPGTRPSEPLRSS